MMDEMEQMDGPQEDAMEPGTPKISQDDQEMFGLILSRSMDALSQNAQAVMAAMKADPVEGAVKFGVQALRTVITAAEKARGQEVPAQVVLAAGYALMKQLASIAVEKGFIADEELETFAKEVAQQGIMEYLKQDAEAGKVNPDQMKQSKVEPTGILAGA